MDSNSVSNSLLIAPVQLNIYFGLFIYITGVIGSIGNIIIYRFHSLRDRACSVYLFWRSVIDLLYLNSVLLTRILQKGFKIPITTRYEVLCKIRQFGSNYGNQLAFTFLALATVDRILISHRSLAFRRWGNRVSLAHKLVMVCSLVWLIVLCHRLVWYGGASRGRCEAQPGTYAYFDNLFDAIVTCLFPMVTLIILGILIGRSVHHVVQRRQILPATTNSEFIHGRRTAIQKMDAQLTMMLFLDIFVAMVSFLPYATHLIYINVTDSWAKSPLRIAWETIIIEMIRLLSYIFFSGSFYVSIIALTGFRDQLLRAIHLKKQKESPYSGTGMVTKTAQNQ